MLFRATLFLLAVLGASSVAQAASPCGDSVVVRRADTLSSIADRCDVSEGSLISANPDVQGSNDLQVGMRMAVHAPGSQDQNVNTQLSRFGHQAENALGSLAGAIGSSAQDLLDRNPDLRSRVDRLKDSVGLGGGSGDARVSVSPDTTTPGSQVRLTATGLPQDSPVSIGAGQPGSAYELIENARSSATGTLNTMVTVPEWVRGSPTLVFVLVGAGRDVEARSGKIALLQ